MAAPLKRQFQTNFVPRWWKARISQNWCQPGRLESPHSQLRPAWSIVKPARNDGALKSLANTFATLPHFRLLSSARFSFAMPLIGLTLVTAVALVRYEEP